MGGVRLKLTRADFRKHVVFFDLARGMCQKWYDLISTLLCSWSLYLDHVVWDWVKEKCGKQSEWVISVICTLKDRRVEPSAQRKEKLLLISSPRYFLHSSPFISFYWHMKIREQECVHTQNDARTGTEVERIAALEKLCTCQAAQRWCASTLPSVGKGQTHKVK